MKETIDPADVDDEPLVEEHVIDSDFVTKLGINCVQLAEECRTKWFECAGQTAFESRDALERWVEAMEMIFALCNGEIERSYREVTHLFQEKAMGEPAPADQPAVWTCLWESSVRHAVNIITAEDASDLHDARAFDWREWILTKSQQGGDHGSDSDGEA